MFEHLFSGIALDLAVGGITDSTIPDSSDMIADVILGHHRQRVGQHRALRQFIKQRTALVSLTGQVTGFGFGAGRNYLQHGMWHIIKIDIALVFIKVRTVQTQEL